MKELMSDVPMPMRERFAEVNGLLVDLRQAPRVWQEKAFRQGMIPYIPADRQRRVKK